MVNNQSSICFFEDLPIFFSEKVVILDIDGTLVADNEDFCLPAISKKVEEIAFKNTVYLLTNSRNGERNKKIEKSCEASLLHSRYRKPCKGVIRGLRHEDKSFVVIGDKFLTDFIFAKRIKAEFILVKRKLSGHERWHIKLINYLDDIFNHLYLWRIKKRI